jgi:gamma-glutamylputrescine oxidase
MPAEHVDSYYAATANDRALRPRLEGDVQAEVCVIGGGFTGVSAALTLAERGRSVVLLEAERVGWGASGRNGGQVNSGWRMGPADLIETFGRDEALRLWTLAEEAKALVRARAARHAIACDLKPGTLHAAIKPRHVAHLEKDARALTDVMKYPHARLVGRAELAAMVATRLYHGGLLDAGAAHLHPLNYALGLARAAEAAGARLFEGTRVLRLERGGAGAATAHGSVRAGHIVLAGDAYLGRLAPEVSATILLLSSYMIATAPLGEARARALIRDDVAVSDSKFVVDYYRLSADRRLLFGGGEIYTEREPADVKGFVRRVMLRVFPQLGDVGIDFGWGGRVSITRTRLPHVGHIDRRTWFAQGYSGQGVALAGLAGTVLAEAICGDTERFELMARLPPGRFPGGHVLRRPLQVGGMLYYALRDRI